MKKLIVILLTLVFSAGMVFASGGKNHGTKGAGNTSTGSTAKGTASQPRTGR